MTADKAIISLVVSVLTMLNLFFGLQIDIATWTGAISALLAAIAPLLVYVIPNRAKA